MAESRYEHLRREMSSRVQGAVLRVCSAELVGSWARGEFHLCKYEGGSLSDIDLVSTASPDDWGAIRHAIVTHIQPFEVTKISVHPPSSFLGLTLQDGYMLNISEYICAKHSETRSEAHGYHRAKLALRLSRISDSELMSETARRTGSAVALRALQVKFGHRREFSVDDAEELLRSQRHLAASSRCLALRVLREPTTSVAAIALRLEQCGSLPQWLRAYQRAKLNSFTPPPHSSST